MKGKGQGAWSLPGLGQGSVVLGWDCGGKGPKPGRDWQVLLMGSVGSKMVLSEGEMGVSVVVDGFGVDGFMAVQSVSRLA